MELIFRTEALLHNLSTLQGRCGTRGVELMAVTKAACSFSPLVELFVSRGLRCLGDSNPHSLASLEGLGIRRTLLKSPPSVFQEGWKSWDEAYVSSSCTSPGMGEVVLVLEVGDGKDGVPPGEASGVIRELEKSGVRVSGLGVNFSCLRGILPSEELWEYLARVTADLRKEFPGLKRFSAGGTVVLDWLEAPLDLPITQIRVGEGLLLGYDSSTGKNIRGLRTDTAELLGEILEVRHKSFGPESLEPARDAFGRTPARSSGKSTRRAVLDLGVLGSPASGLQPLDQGVEILGQTYDFLVVGLEGAAEGFLEGQKLRFRPDYGALSQASLNPFVKKTLFP